MNWFKHGGWFFAAVFMVAITLGQISCSQPVAENKPYSEAEFAALQALVNAASASSDALSGEVQADWEKTRPDLGAAINGLETAFGPDAFNGLIAHTKGAWPDLEKAPDLTHARAAYLKVSDNLAQIVLIARKNDPRMGKVIVYYCSMTADPADARWVQTAAPLTNPFWGVYMADCCREIKP